jgi:HAD superfamily hydrolase (TIGR01548 family)
VLIFDVDGVLVDVRGSFHRSTLETVRFFTGKRVRAAEIQRWKLKGGFNDDWKLTTHWIRALGGKVPYEAVKRRFMQFYWGENEDGNVLREEWLVPLKQLRAWKQRAELALFTGRTRRELQFTLERVGADGLFARIVTMDDLTRLKPHPDGLLRILNGRDPASALYVGDNVDDGKAAARAGVPFIGVLPRGDSRRMKRAALMDVGALDVLHSATELDSWIEAPAAVRRRNHWGNC